MPDAPDPVATHEVTQLLRQWSAGDPGAGDQLMRFVYGELRQMAARYAPRRGNAVLQPTALVHEAFLRLVDQRSVTWQNRAHFFGLAAQMMRRVAVDDARHQGRRKRGGDVVKIAIEDADEPAQPRVTEPVDIIALDRALAALEAADPDAARVVELRFFGGLTVEETAEVLQSSPTTVKREWAVARAWLYQQITDGSDTPDKS